VALLFRPQPDCPLPGRARTQRFLPLIRDTLRNRPFVRLALTHAVLALTGIAGPFYSAYLLRDVGVSYFGLGLLNAVSTAAVLLASPFYGRWVDRFGCRPILVSGFLIVSPLALVWTGIPPGVPARAYWLLPVTNFISGFAFAGVGVAISTLMYKTSRPEGRSVQFALYNSFVVLLAALMKKPTVILEQNALPGFTNRKLSRFVDLVIVSFASSLSYFGDKAILVGNPVRPEFYEIQKKKRDRVLTLLIFGGSQGSRFLNDRIIESLPQLQELKDSLLIYHQTGEKDLNRVSQAYLEHSFSRAVVAAFFSPMADYLGKADLVICRAGATTCAELIAARKPALLVPFAAAADNHQEFNAREMEKAGGAEVILEKDFQPGLLAEKIKYYLNHTEALDRMEQSLEKLRPENVAEKIAGLCLDRLKTRAGGARG